MNHLLRLLNLAISLCLAVGVNVHAQQNESRIALVIGNSAYKQAPLTNPVNDARAIARALQESGFSVIIRENTDHRAMLTALREFGDRLRAGDTGLFYYAGHGMQIKGRNYLIPVGADIDREDEVAYGAVDAQAVLDKMEAAGNVANIMILDACRNNPFTRGMRSAQAGLAQMDAPVGTLLAYATSPGAVASDGDGANGLYTQHLLSAIRQPGLKVEDVFKQVRANVRRDSRGTQIPWESTSLEGDFYFRGAPVLAKPIDPAEAMEIALWDAFKGGGQPIEIKVYLNRYPSGKFATQAQALLAQLQFSATERATAEANQKAATERARAEAIQKATKERLVVDANRKAADERVAAEARRTAVAERAAAEATEQAALKKRTEELLASSPPQAAPLPTVAPAPERPALPSPASNSLGFTVGDRWRYQVVDKWKKEVVDNVDTRVDKILANGNMEWNNGFGIRTPEGNWLRNGAVTYSPQLVWLPKDLRVGYKQDVKFTLTSKKQNSEYMEEHEGILAVRSKEKIKVPAGEFDAYRIELDLEFTGGKAIGNRWFGTMAWVFWYVPELRHYVAWDRKARVGTSVVEYSRQELTSFSVRGAENLAQR